MEAIRVHRLTANYAISGGIPKSHWARERLDSIARKLLPELLHDMVPDAEGITIIQRLQVDLDIDIAAPEDRVARAWASQIAAALSSAIGVHGSGSVTYKTRAALLADYIQCVAAGHSLQDWRFRRFEGMKLLPASQALRTIICDDPQAGIDALLHLSDRDRHAVLSAASENDAARILSALASTGADTSASLAAFLDVFEEMRIYSPSESWLHRLSLRLYLAAIGNPGGGSGLAAAGLCRAIVSLAALGSQLSEASVSRLAKAISDGSVSRLYEIAGAARGDLLTPLLGSKQEHLFRILTPLRQGTASPDVSYTPFGGIFLLLPILAELDFEAPALLRLWIALHCLGHDRAHVAFRDGLLQSFLGVQADCEAFLHWQRSFPQARAAELAAIAEKSSIVRDNHTFRHHTDGGYLCLPRALRSSIRKDRTVARISRLVLRGLAWRLPGFSQSSFPHLFSNFLDFSASVEENDSRVTVRTGSPPLQLLLNLTGQSRQTYTLPWRPAKAITLFPEA